MIPNQDFGKLNLSGHKIIKILLELKLLKCIFFLDYAVIFENCWIILDISWQKIKLWLTWLDLTVI